MEIFISVFFITYLALHLYFLKGLRISTTLEKFSLKNPPSVSLIVAAKNEKDVIARCIQSLKEIKYEGTLEIILVNDKSDDNTKEIMIKESQGDSRIKVIDSNRTETSNLKGKANALDTAIRLCRGEIVITTDADCTVQSEWVKSMSSYYDTSTAMVNGFTTIDTNQKLFDKLQALDFIYLLSLASSSCGIGRILSCIGNNISFRKDIYMQLGGFEKIGFSVTEDLALMRAIDSIKNVEIKFPTDDRNVVTSQPCADLRALFNQKKRWFRGGLGIRPFGYITGIELYIANLYLLTGIFFTPPAFYFTMVGIKFVSELILLIPLLKIYKSTGLLKYFIHFQIYFALYGLLLPFTFVLGNKIKWKGRKY